MDDLQVYQMAMDFGEKVWNIVLNWGYFEKETIGKQFVKAADSIAANLSEGFGIFFYKENKQLCYYSRGSLFETRTWLIKATNRKLISKENSQNLLEEITLIGKKLNSYINSIGKHSAVDLLQDGMTNVK